MYSPTSASTPDYLDQHNGRFCVTPEYPNGIYCYFATVDANWNSAYPYVVGPTFYGTIVTSKVTSITETVNTYVPLSTGLTGLDVEKSTINVYPNPSSDLVVVQIADITRGDVSLELLDAAGKVVDKTSVLQGSTIAYFDTKTLYAGMYFIRISSGDKSTMKKVLVEKE